MADSCEHSNEPYGRARRRKQFDQLRDYQQEELPQQWKESIIVPIHKKGNN
jgi:hypothetical protein